MQIHNTLPEGAWRARDESEFYQLLPRKKNLYEENRELREGLRYLIWSRYARRYYERILDKQATTEEDISYYLQRNWLFIYPTEENKNWIREEVEKHKLGYWKLMRRRQGEMDWERHNQKRNDGNGYAYRMEKYKQEKNKYRKA
jgi:hypothetical protein